MRSSKEILERNGICLWHMFFVNEDEDTIKPLLLNSKLAGFYHVKGYKYLSAHLSGDYSYLPSETKEKIVQRISINVTLMNQDKRVSVLVDYLSSLFSETLYTGRYEAIERSKIENLVSNYIGGVIEPKFKTGYYQWTRILTKIEKKKTIASNNSNEVSQKNFGLIQRVVQHMVNDNEYANIFITAQSLIDFVDKSCGELLSMNTIRKYTAMFKMEIDDHNIDAFGCSSFTMYQKFLSVHKIKSSLGVINKLGSKLSKMNISKQSGLHYNTILNLWDEDDVQNELSKYHEVITVK